jgi:PAS domain S-box-containing protein
MPDGPTTEIDVPHDRIAQLDERCRDLEGVQESFLKASAALSAKAGEEFFTSLVAHLSRSLEMECVCVAEVSDAGGQRMRTTAMAFHGAVVPNIEYDLRGTPCETIFGRELCYYASGITRLFPLDQWLIDMRAESYIGAPLFDSGGRPLGLVAAIDTKPLAHPRFVASIFAMLAARVAGELERKTVAAELRESHEFNRQVIDSVQGLVAYDPDLRYVLWNRHMQALSGLSAAEVVGRRPSELFPFTVECGVEEVIRRALAGSPAEIDGIRFHFPQSGRSGWSSVRYYPLRDNSGRIIGAIGNVIETTASHESRAALRESEERLRMAFAAGRMFPWDYDLAAQRSVASADLAAFLGLEPGSPVPDGDAFLQLVHPDDRAAVREAGQHAIRDRVNFETEFRILLPGGDVRWLATNGKAFFDQRGRPVRMIGVTRDIDDHKRLEENRAQLDARVQQAQKLETLGTLAGGVAHDFNNLLQAILGNAGLIREYAPAIPDVQNCVHQIETASQRASELTQQLLAYAGKGKFVIEAVDLSRMALEMSHLLEASLPRRARVVGQFPPGLAPVAGDPTQLRQVIMNLVINASESLPEGNGVIRLATGLVHLAADELSGLLLGSGLAAGKYIYLEVCDTGIGMDAQTCAKIFDPFYTTKDKGRGLGLAAVLGIVRGHHGALQVHSQPGEGTVVRVLLPAAEKTTMDRPAIPTHAGPAPRMEGTILVVDDEPAVRDAARLLLENMGFRVVPAADGVEALRLFRDRHLEITAVLLDLTMPLMSGAEAFRELRAMRPDIPILLTSGFSEEEAVRKAQGNGPASFIQKPYRADQLRARLFEVLRE